MLRGLGGWKLKPSASAPRSTASFASAQLVIPQIFTRTGCVPAILLASRREQIFQRRSGIGIAHQMLAYQKRVKTSSSQPLEIINRTQPGFAYGNAVLGNRFDQLE